MSPFDSCFKFGARQILVGKPSDWHLALMHAVSSAVGYTAT